MHEKLLQIFDRWDVLSLWKAHKNWPKEKNEFVVANIHEFGKYTF